MLTIVHRCLHAAGMSGRKPVHHLPLQVGSDTQPAHIYICRESINTHSALPVHSSPGNNHKHPPPPTTTTTPSHTGTSGGKPVHHLPLQLGPDTQHPPLVLGVEEVEHQSLRLAVPAEELSDSLRQLPVLRLIAAIAHETGKQIIGYH